MTITVNGASITVQERSAVRVDGHVITVDGRRKPTPIECYWNPRLLFEPGGPFYGKVEIDVQVST